MRARGDPLSASETILVLGGTAEANALVGRLAALKARRNVILSLAGRTTAPMLPSDCTVRIGGFGGAAGLATFCIEANIVVLVDATHPFAAGISRNAAEASRISRIPRIALVRPAWEPVKDDRWFRVDGLAAARDALPHGARPFLALGRQHIAPFLLRTDLRAVVRMIDPPEPPLPFAADLVLAKPAADPNEEAKLFKARGISHLVCRNSGGAASYAKIAAARTLGLPVILIDRLPAPPEPVVKDVEAVIAWLIALQAH